jgi:hypothetical protein
MSLDNVYTIGAAAFSHASTSDFNLDGVVNVGLNPEVADRVLYGAGQHLATHVHVHSIMPMINLSVTDIATALANIDPDAGLAVDSGGAAFDLLDLYFTKKQNLGTRGGSGVHFKTTVNLCLVVPRLLTLQQDMLATLEIDVYVIYDGTNDPFVYVQNASLPHVPSIDEAFTLGPFNINGSLVDGFDRVTVNFGNEVKLKAAGGALYPQHVNIDQHGPSIELYTSDLGVLDDFNLEGTAISASDVIFYAKKYANEGNYVADNTAEHIKFTLDKGMVIPASAGGANNADSEAQLKIVPIYDGTNDPIVLDTASAIT